MNNENIKPQTKIVSTFIVIILSIVFSSVIILNVSYHSYLNKQLNANKLTCVSCINNMDEVLTGLLVGEDISEYIHEDGVDDDHTFKQHLIQEINAIENKENSFFINNINVIKHSLKLSESEYNETIDNINILLKLSIKKMDNNSLTDEEKETYSLSYSIVKGNFILFNDKIITSVKDSYNDSLSFSIFSTVLGLLIAISFSLATFILEKKQLKLSKFLYQRNIMLDILTKNANQGLLLFDKNTKKIEYESNNIKYLYQKYGDDIFQAMNVTDRNNIYGILRTSDLKEQLAYEVMLSNQEKQGWYYIKFIPISSKNRLNKIAICINDFTEIKEYNNTLLTAVNEAKSASTAKQVFLSNMSHEIRTPLTTIIGLSELALQTNDRTKQSLYLDKIYSSSNHLLTLLSDVLTISKIECGKIVINNDHFDLSSTLKAINNIIEPQIENKGQKYTICNHLNTSHLFGDESKIKQILINILSNALKYTPTNGEIELSINDDIKGNINTVTFVVKDNGNGISEEYLKDIYKPFERENSNDGLGTGLGLNITKNIINLMHGTINIDSKKNVGTSVTISIPFVVDKTQETTINTEFDFHCLRILLVEDKKINAQIIKEFLELKNAYVETVDNGTKAINKARKNSYDIILMDIQMPVMTGYQATQQIRSFNKDVIIIALTANAFSESIEKAIDSGMNDYLIKPVSMNKLYTKIHKYKKCNIENKKDK